MATYYGPKQRITDKQWDYCASNSHACYPIGYCHNYPYDESNESLKELFGGLVHWEHAKAKAEPFKDKYHTNGHATEEEACQCYTDYLLDNELSFGEDTHSQKKCKVCDEWTTGRAYVNHHSFDLCPKHQTREEVAKLYTAGETWSF